MRLVARLRSGLVGHASQISGEGSGPALPRFLIKRRQPVLDQHLLQSAPCLGGSGHIAAEADAQLVGHSAALQGFAVGRQVGLAVVFAFPTAIGHHGFAHVEQQRLLEIRRSIQHR